MVIVYTQRVTYSGPDRLDIARSSAGPDGLPFAPSWTILRPMLNLRRSSEGLTAWAWRKYSAQYTEEMRRSYVSNRAAWDALLARDEVTLLCYCTDPVHCHRTVLAGILAKLGAEVRGERELGEWR
jgi:hypothetical protein